MCNERREAEKIDAHRGSYRRFLNRRQPILGKIRTDKEASMRIVQPKRVHIVFLCERFSEFTADFLTTMTELSLGKVLTADEEKKLTKIYNALQKVDADMVTFKKNF